MGSHDEPVFQAQAASGRVTCRLGTSVSRLASATSTGRENELPQSLSTGVAMTPSNVSIHNLHPARALLIAQLLLARSGSAIKLLRAVKHDTGHWRFAVQGSHMTGYNKVVMVIATTTRSVRVLSILAECGSKNREWSPGGDPIRGMRALALYGNDHLVSVIGGTGEMTLVLPGEDGSRTKIPLPTEQEASLLRDALNGAEEISASRLERYITVFSLNLARGSGRKCCYLVNQTRAVKAVAQCAN